MRGKDEVVARIRGRMAGTIRKMAEGGLLEPGNIDLMNRPIVHNADGSISTVRTMGVEFDGQHVNIPTVSPDGRIMDGREAVGLYREFGKHLGIYGSREAAEEAAQRLHEEQARIYSGERSLLPAAQPGTEQ